MAIVAQDAIGTAEIMAVLAYFAQHDNKLGGLRQRAFWFVTTQRVGEITWDDLRILGWMANDSHLLVTGVPLPDSVPQNRVWAILHALSFSRDTWFRRQAMRYMASKHRSCLTDEALQALSELATKFLATIPVPSA